MSLISLNNIGLCFRFRACPDGQDYNTADAHTHKREQSELQVTDRKRNGRSTNNDHRRYRYHFGATANTTVGLPVSDNRSKELTT